MATLKYYPHINIAFLDGEYISITLRKAWGLMDKASITARLHHLNYERSGEWEKVGNHYEAEYRMTK